MRASSSILCSNNCCKEWLRRLTVADILYTCHCHDPSDSNALFSLQLAQTLCSHAISLPLTNHREHIHLPQTWSLFNLEYNSITPFLLLYLLILVFLLYPLLLSLFGGSFCLRPCSQASMRASTCLSKLGLSSARYTPACRKHSNASS